MKTIPELEAEIRVLREMVAAQGKTIEMLLKQPAAAPPQPVFIPCTRPHKDDPVYVPYPTWPQPQYPEWIPGGFPYGTITVTSGKVPTQFTAVNAPPQYAAGAGCAAPMMGMTVLTIGANGVVS